MRGSLLVLFLGSLLSIVPAFAKGSYTREEASSFYHDPSKSGRITVYHTEKNGDYDRTSLEEQVKDVCSGGKQGQFTANNCENIKELVWEIFEETGAERTPFPPYTGRLK